MFPVNPHLHSAFGRRILLLLALCIVAPGAVFGFLSLRQVEEKFHQETVRRIRLQNRQIVMTIHGAFTSIETEMEILAGALADGTTPALRRSTDWNGLFRNRHLLGATRFRGGSRVETLYGDPCPPPPRTDDARRHLAAGRGLIYPGRSPDGAPRFYIAHAIGEGDPGREQLAGEVNLEYLWERVRDAAPPVTEIAVLARDGTPLFQTRPLPGPVQRRIEEERARGHAGSFEWGQGSSAMLADLSTVFMKPAFLADDWIVVISQPRSEAFAASNRFTRVLFLSIALVVLLAGLFAHVQIRRSLAPLAVLEEGTRRISGGDFDSRVEIASGDEFQDLALSFNAMADHLGREFRVQAEMGRTVRTILGGTEIGTIVGAVLDNVKAVLPCECVGLTLLEPGPAMNDALTFTREYSSPGPPATGRITLSLSMDEIRRLESAEQSVIVEKGGDFGNFLSGWTGTRPAAFLLSPLLSREKLAGVLIVGCRIPPNPSPERLIRLRQIADQTAIALSRARLIEDLARNELGTLTALARTVDTNSPWTAGHSERVTDLAMELGRELGWSTDDIDRLHRGGLLHDIGKIGVHPAILDKPGKLTEEEFAVIRRHPLKGAEILEPIPNLRKIIPVVLQHHERFDGKGYPYGLSGESISPHARVLAVADVVDALVSDRPYRPGWSRETVLAYTRENAGLQFDPQVVEAYHRIEARRAVPAAAARNPAPPGS